MPDSTDNRSYIAADWSLEYARCRPVPLGKTEVDGYLGKRIDRNLASLMLGLQSPIPAGFEAAAVGKEPPPFEESAEGSKTGTPSRRLAADSDVYKWLEGACYTFVTTGDAALKKEIDRIVALIVTCQEDDGYINGQVNQRHGGIRGLNTISISRGTCSRPPPRIIEPQMNGACSTPHAAGPTI